MVDNDPIPVSDCEPSGTPIVHYPGTAGATVRGKRTSPRKPCENVLICFSPDLKSGRIDHAECPVTNISKGGMTIEYDQALQPGARGNVCYRAAAGRPVNVGCVVRRCEPLPGGRFSLGLALDRKLQFEETKPARVGIGREVAPGLRARKLRPTDGTSPDSSSV